MLDQLSRNAGHVSRFPYKHVDVSADEADERVFLFGVETGPDPGRPASVADHELNLLYVFGLSHRLRWLLSRNHLLLCWGLLGITMQTSNLSERSIASVMAIPSHSQL